MLWKKYWRYDAGTPTRDIASLAVPFVCVGVEIKEEPCSEKTYRDV
jgi:hypothetical protein